jgi:hypothetical protein
MEHESDVRGIAVQGLLDVDAHAIHIEHIPGSEHMVSFDYLQVVSG